MKQYCIFSAHYLPHLGGVERYTYNLAKTLVARGNHVTIVTSAIFGEKEYESLDGIAVYRLPCIPFMDGRYPVLKRNKAFKRLEKKIWASSYDLVIVNTRLYIHSLYGVYQSKKRKIKCITIEHGTGHFSVGNSVLDRLGACYEWGLTWLEKRFCHEYYGVSKACNVWLKHFFIRAKGVLYNCVDVEAIEEIRKKSSGHYRKQYEIPSHASVIAFTGRLIAEKGVLELVDAVEKLRAEGSDVYLMLAGDGELLDEVRKRASKSVISLGRLSFEQVVGLLEESDIFCLPTSFAEGFPTSVLEAAACKCYVVTTTKGGSKELILNSGYGSILTNVKKELYEELKRVLETPKERKLAIDKTYQRLVECFSWNQVVDKVESICERNK